MGKNSLLKDLEPKILKSIVKMAEKGKKGGVFHFNNDASTTEPLQKDFATLECSAERMVFFIRTPQGRLLLTKKGTQSDLRTEGEFKGMATDHWIAVHIKKSKKEKITYLINLTHKVYFEISNESQVAPGFQIIIYAENRGSAFLVSIVKTAHGIPVLCANMTDNPEIGWQFLQIVGRELVHHLGQEDASRKLLQSVFPEEVTTRGEDEKE